MHFWGLQVCRNSCLFHDRCFLFLVLLVSFNLFSRCVHVGVGDRDDLSPSASEDSSESLTETSTSSLSESEVEFLSALPAMRTSSATTSPKLTSLVKFRSARPSLSRRGEEHPELDLPSERCGSSSSRVCGSRHESAFPPSLLPSTQKRSPSSPFSRTHNTPPRKETSLGSRDTATPLHSEEVENEARPPPSAKRGAGDNPEERDEELASSLQRSSSSSGGLPVMSKPLGASPSLSARTSEAASLLQSSGHSPIAQPWSGRGHDHRAAAASPAPSPHASSRRGSVRASPSSPASSGRGIGGSLHKQRSSSVGEGGTHAASATAGGPGPSSSSLFPTPRTAPGMGLAKSVGTGRRAEERDARERQQQPAPVGLASCTSSVSGQRTRAGRDAEEEQQQKHLRQLGGGVLKRSGTMALASKWRRRAQAAALAAERARAAEALVQLGLGQARSEGTATPEGLRSGGGKDARTREAREGGHQPQTYHAQRLLLEIKRKKKKKQEGSSVLSPEQEALHSSVLLGRAAVAAARKAAEEATEKAIKAAIAKNDLKFRMLGATLENWMSVHTVQQTKVWNVIFPGKKKSDWFEDPEAAGGALYTRGFSFFPLYTPLELFSRVSLIPW